MGNTTRDDQVINATVHKMLGEHARGDTCRVLGERYGYSHEGVRKLLIREGTRMINEVEVNLDLAAKQEQLVDESAFEYHEGDRAARLRMSLSVEGEDAHRLARMAEARGQKPSDVVAELLRDVDRSPA
jgi:hypothetical protein